MLLLVENSWTAQRELSSVEAGAKESAESGGREDVSRLLLCSIWSLFASITGRTHGEEKEDVAHYRSARKWVKLALKLTLYLEVESTEGVWLSFLQGAKLKFEFSWNSTPNINNLTR